MEKYQTFWPRLGALLIDSFIMLPLGILNEWFREAEFPPLFFYVWIPVSLSVATVYTILMHWFYGQTLGKMFLNVKVLDASGDSIRFSQAVRRSVPQIVLNIAAIVLGIAFLGAASDSQSAEFAYGQYGLVAGFWGIADILTFCSNDKRRALHDLIAGTVVVRVNNESNEINL